MSEILVTIPQGKLRGSVEEDLNGKEYFCFLGVPYAAPPLGSLRFKDPQPPQPWDGLRDATKEGMPCYTKQIIPSAQSATGFEFELYGSEDCLFLNIFTRELLQRKPVMVYIHGGGFTTGNNSVQLQGPKLLITEDIVLVTINYRLGVLGFLSEENEGIGNAGLKDMVQSLKWVQQNIKFFGGDPNNVTIFGLSSGGAAVQYLVLSPLAKGLFHKAIAQSGSALNHWALGKQNNFADIAKATGCATVEQLQKLPVEKLLEAQFALGDDFKPSRVRYFSPTVEPESPSAFLSKTPIEAITSGRFNQVDFIIGYTNLEGVTFVDYSMPKLSELVGDSNFSHFVPHLLGLEIESEEYNKINRKIIQFYFGKDSVDLSNKTALYDLTTDVSFLRGIFISAKLQAKTSTKPVYLYRFSADTKLNVFKSSLGNANLPAGAVHGDHLRYLFKNQKEPVIEPGSVEHAVSQGTVKLWTSFAKNGRPTCDQLEWKPVKKDSVDYLEIGNELSMHHGSVPEDERMKFWDSIFANFDY